MTEDRVIYPPVGKLTWEELKEAWDCGDISEEDFIDAARDLDMCDEAEQIAWESQ